MKKNKKQRGPLTPKKRQFHLNDSISTMCEHFGRRDATAMKSVQLYLDTACGVGTLPLLHCTFLSSHAVACRKSRGLIEVMADCLKTAITRRVSAAAYPIEIATDGTMTMTADEPIVKVATTLSFNNFGDTRLGVAIVCDRVSPLGFKVLVGPFFELLRDVRSSTNSTPR